ncbi:MAG TPA: DUF4097 family beta strand repeat-containing protein [Natrialbaceae archaeon]|nr:DUF4097 family beta strand repeat-containing protein [Natrialbaceae archaeon]
MRRRTLLAGLPAAVGSLSGCIYLNIGPRTERSIDREVPVRDATTLSLRVTNGDVSVEGDGGDAVRLEGTKWTRGDESILDRLRLRVERADGQLMIASNEGEFSRPVGIDVDATIPDGLLVGQVASTNGDVRLSNLTGDDLAVDTVNGDVLFESVDAAPDVDTNNGDVRGQALADLRSIWTVNGEIDVELEGLSDDAVMHTTNGDVTARLGGIDARIVARTKNGDVSVDGLDVSIDTSTRKRLEGTIGTGGPELRIRTTNGDVTLLE